MSGQQEHLPVSTVQSSVESDCGRGVRSHSGLTLRFPLAEATFGAMATSTECPL